VYWLPGGLPALVVTLPDRGTTASVLGWPSTRRLLRAAVALLGLQLALAQVLSLGPGILLAVVTTVAVSFAGTLWIARLLGFSRGLRILVATGFSICGASAVAAVSAVVDHEDDDVATAMGLVTVFGGLAIVGLPALAGALQLPGDELGHWAGLSLPEVGQVVAAAAPAGAVGVTAAVVVKLSRVVLLAPLVAVISVVEARSRAVERRTRPPIVPLMVLCFLASMLLRATGLVPGGGDRDGGHRDHLAARRGPVRSGHDDQHRVIGRRRAPRARARRPLRPPAGRNVARRAACPGGVRRGFTAPLASTLRAE
jgi:uncharacterized membrane protein YadS